MDLKQGDLENIILNALWDLEDEGTLQIFVSDVQERIKSPQRKWAYTTVKTVLDRLVDKGLADRQKQGKKYFYQSLMNREAAGELALRKLIRQFFQDDLDELLGCVAKLREEGVGIRKAMPVPLISHELHPSTSLPASRNNVVSNAQESASSPASYAERTAMTRRLARPAANLSTAARPELVGASSGY